LEAAVSVVRVEGLYKAFFVKRGSGWGWGKDELRAVDGVSFSVAQGETFGLVGESGCGKSTVGNCLLRLTIPDQGRLVFHGQDLARLSGRALRRARSGMAVVFQDPQSSLDPRMTVRGLVAAPLRVGRHVRRFGTDLEVEQRVAVALREVGLGAEHMSRYAHEFSGGQRQRIAIARALITNPAFIVLDEPTSALDVSVQAQVLNLLQDIQKRRGVSYLFISHDLTVIRHMSRRVGVMYLGVLVENAMADNLFLRPLHPYTQALLAAAPIPDPRTRQNLAVLPGDPPSPVRVPPGCRFHPRCPSALPVCKQSAPPRVYMGPEHVVACHLYKS